MTGSDRRPKTPAPGTWALAAVLAAGLLAACEADGPVTGPGREGAPGEATVSPEAGAESQLDVGTTAVSHWADGYVWAFNPTASSYSASGSYAFNRSGGAITITKPAGTTGQYSVKFTGLSALLGTKSTVKVTGYNTDNTYCKPTASKLTSDVIGIRCFNANTGAPVNAYYTVLVLKKRPTVAFAHANLPTGTDYAPPGGSSWNPAGAIRVFRNGTGNYSVRFTGLGSQLTANGGHAQVVHVGSGAQHCKVGGWGGSPDLFVNVLCYRQTGVPVDAKFNLLFLLPASHLGYAWANAPTTSSYTPSTFYSSNSGGGAVQITRRGTGLYTVTFNSLSSTLLDGADVQVSAYGGGNAQCKVEFWGPESVSVRCFGPTGALVDSYYDVLMGS